MSKRELSQAVSAAVEAQNGLNDLASALEKLKLPFMLDDVNRMRWKVRDIRCTLETELEKEP